MNNQEITSLKKEKFKYATTSGAITCLFIVAVILFNIVITTLGEKVTLKLDWTQNQILDFSEITYQTLDNLDKDINVYSLIPKSSGDEVAVCLEEILKKYQRLSNHVHYSVVDANKNPTFMNKYVKDSAQLSAFSIIFECDNKFKIVDLSDSINYMSYDGNYIEYTNAEKKFTQAILFVINDDNTNITVLDGMHGEYIYSSEYPAYDIYYETFKNTNYVIDKLDIANEEISEDTDVIFLATPMTDYTTDEIEKLRKFLKQGKTLQVCFDQNNNNLKNLTAFLKDEWGINYLKGTLMEGDSTKYTNATPYSVVPTYEQSEITNPLIKSRLEMLVLLPIPITIDEIDNIERTVLATTSDKAFVKNSDKLDTYAYEEGDKKDKYIISAVLEDSKLKGKVQVISGGFAILGAQYNTCANMDFYQNSISYLTDNMSEISVRPRDMTSQTFLVSNSNLLILLAVFVLFVPLFVLIIGLAVWLRRRFL